MTQDKIYQTALKDVINGRLIIDGVPQYKAAIIAKMLRDFEPVVPPTAGGDNATSHEIAEMLTDMCQVNTSDVAAVMVALGYEMYLTKYDGFEWAMRCVNADKDIDNDDVQQ